MFARQDQERRNRRHRHRVRTGQLAAALIAIPALALTGCGSSGGGGSQNESAAQTGAAGQTAAGNGASAVANGASAAAGSTGSGASCSHMDKVTFLNILPLTSLSYSAEMVADTGGFFKKQCLDVSFQTTKGSAQAIQTIISGKALLTWVGTAETMVDNAKGAPVVTVGIKEPNTELFVSSKKDPVTNAAQLKGKLIGLPSAGGTSETILKLALSSVGLKESDVKTQVVGLAPGVYNLVESGRIAAYAVSLDTAILLQQQHSDARVLNPANHASDINFITSKSQANDPKKADQIRRFLKALYNAETFIVNDQKNDFAKTIELISSKYKVPTLENEKIRVGVLQKYAAAMTFQGKDNMLRVVPASWKKAYQLVVQAGLVKPGLDPSTWYTNKFSPTSGS
jgi:NitT/TauT family transport system substrate-binding protein